MRNRLKRHSIVCVAILLGMQLVGCGSNKYSSQSTYGASGSYYKSDDLYEAAMPLAEEAYADEDYAYDNYEDATTSSSNVDSVEVKETGSQRKLIKNYNLSVETMDFSVLIHTVEAKVEVLGGYIESSSVDTKSNGTHYAYYTIRIPKSQAEQFVSTMEDASNITSQSVDVQDVTLQYVDLSSHKTALVTEQNRLLELLEKAETIEDIIVLEERLSNVRYQIESMESQLRTFDNQVDYSTVRLNITEVIKLTEPEKETIWGRITDGFGDSIVDIGTGFVNAFVWFLVKIPYILLWAVVILIVWFIILKIEKGSKKKREKKTKKMLERAQSKENQVETIQNEIGENADKVQVEAQKEPKEGEGSNDTTV